MVVISFASSIAVTFVLNQGGKDLSTFLTSFVSVSFSPRVNDSFAKSRTRTLNSAMVSSSAILNTSNFEDRI